MAINLDELIADAEQKRAEAAKRAAAAKKQADSQQKDSEKDAVYNRLNDYIKQLMEAKTPFEDTIKRYAQRIARGDKLDVLEKQELDNAIKQYNSVDSNISKTQKDVYDLYAGKITVSDVLKKRPEAKPTATTTTTTTGAPAVEMPMGAGTPKAAGKTPIQKGAEALGKQVTPTPTPSKTPPKKVTSGPAPTSVSSGSYLNAPTALTAEDLARKALELGYGAIDSVFKTVPELTNLLTRAVNEKWQNPRFQSELQNTNWFKSNATTLQQRGFYKRQYNDLVNGLPADGADRQTKIDELNSTTEYGRGLARVKRLIQSEAIAEGAVIEDAALSLLAQDIYDHALENDGLAIRDYVKANIKYQPGKILSGKAGTDLADLKATARANGLDLDKAFGTSIQGWLQKLASGESVDTYKNIIRQAAKIGMPEKVASLLDNGVDLSTIYEPYKNLMASTLEISPETIGLDDPTLRTAITPQSELSLYDFQKMLRKDNRWQYTKQARDEVSTGVQKVLQDFGFMG